MDTSDVHAKGQGQRSKIEVTELKANFAPADWFGARYQRFGASNE